MAQSVKDNSASQFTRDGSMQLLRIRAAVKGSLRLLCECDSWWIAGVVKEVLACVLLMLLL